MGELEERGNKRKGKEGSGFFFSPHLRKGREKDCFLLFVS